MIDGHQCRYAPPLPISKWERMRSPRQSRQNEGLMLHIDIPTLEEFKGLAQIKGETCISLYLPTSPLAESVRAKDAALQELQGKVTGE